tara:strand:- start:1244 stop:1489 length:246 start_codon:yes stop_codon:yes gene_type:complete
MNIRKSSFIKNYKNKLSPKIFGENDVYAAIEYAFKLTDRYGVGKINQAIFESSVKYKIDQDVLTETINNMDTPFIWGEENE